MAADQKIGSNGLQSLRWKIFSGSFSAKNALQDDKS